MSNRDRDLVLAPNEFAFISDQTKGNINAYVGPFKTSLANTDQPVKFNNSSKRFEECLLEESKQLFPTAPKGWYAVIKNPALNEAHPKTGTVNNLVELKVGHKVNLPGPVTFALWPGQMGKIIKGHQLRSNQYLLVRVYDEEAAKENWGKAVIERQASADDVPRIQESHLTMGNQLIIRGTEVSFYIPPTGIEVVPIQDNYVRDAVSLERLEYCILLDENGNKRFIQGPDVVFPKPTETFITMNGQRTFRAVELNEISGIYVKIIAPYEENGVKYNVGDERFITGKEQMIYFPRPEHAIIKYGDIEIHHSVAIPEGEGRYVLNRHTGQIRLVRGPTMFLADPRKEVIVRRVLEPRHVQLWFPGNTEALEYNRRLKKYLNSKKTGTFILDQELQENAVDKATATGEVIRRKAAQKSETISKKTRYTPPRTITLDTKYDGAVNISIWTGYAILVVSKSGERKVIVGPKAHLLEYDETLEYMTLSTGTPKTDKQTIRSVYLRVLHNKVSDIVEVETKDLCKLRIELSFRVNFEGEPQNWFNVENYVKFLTDHMRSMLRNAVKKHKVQAFYSDAISLLRDTILGKQGEDGKRPGRRFSENGMHVYDVEILGVDLGDEAIEEMLIEAQHSVVSQTLELESKQRQLQIVEESELIKQKIQDIENQTKLTVLEIQLQQLKKAHQLQMEKLNTQRLQQQAELQTQLAEREALSQLNTAELDRRRANANLDLEINQRKTDMQLQHLQAEVEALANKANAISPDLIAALQAFGDRAMVEKVSESMAPLAILGGDSVADILSRLLKGTSLERVLSPPEE